MTNDTCPACGSDSTVPVMSLPRVPTNSCLLLDSEAAAMGHPTGVMRVILCQACGFVANAAFDAELTAYTEAYEETQGFSPRFQAFADNLASKWVTDHRLDERHVLEIGCGKGEFLTLLSKFGVPQATGIDPAFDPRRSAHDPTRITFIQDRFDDRYVDLDADAVVCRHTLEHVGNVREFLHDIRRLIGDRTNVPLLLELPDSTRIFEEVAFWDVYYEHCSYFTPGSLARLLRSEGFVVHDLWLAYADQYIIAEVYVGQAASEQRPLPIEDPPAVTRSLVAGFTDAYTTAVTAHRASLSEWTQRGERIVIWGASSKGVGWLTSLGASVAEVPYAVDINPYKHGKFMAGTGQRIVAPEFLAEYKPDRIVIMNSVYVDEISATLADIGVVAELTTI